MYAMLLDMDVRKMDRLSRSLGLLEALLGVSATGNWPSIDSRSCYHFALVNQCCSLCYEEVSETGVYQRVRGG